MLINIFYAFKAVIIILAHLDRSISSWYYSWLYSVTVAVILLSLLSFNSTTSFAQTKIYVSSSATGTGAGTSWANAYSDLQSAITRATAGDQIWVAKGIYSPGALAASTFALKDWVQIYGGFAGTESSLSQRDLSKLRTENETILHGKKEAADVASTHVVSNLTNVSNATVLDGFTITGGQAAATGAVGAAANSGAGIYTIAGDPVFSNLWIKSNTAAYGAGMFAGASATATLKNVLFSLNSTAAIASSRGGGILNLGSLTISDAIFDNNTVGAGASNCGGGIANAGNLSLTNVVFKNNIVAISTGGGWGGGLISYTVSTLTTMKNVQFTDNQSRIGGGFCLYDGSATLDQVAFTGNTSTTGGGGMQMGNGPGVPETAKLNNVIFSRNSSSATTAGAGGLWLEDGTMSITNGTFSNNSAGITTANTLGGGAIFRSAGVLNVYNSIFWGNTSANGVGNQLNAGINTYNCLIQGGYTTGNNLDTNPLYIDATTDQLQLQDGSPAINSGDNDQVANLQNDYAGNLRIINQTVDLGAYENTGQGALYIQGVFPSTLARGQPFSTLLTAAGGNGAYSWTVSSGALPNGLLLSSTGLLSGTPVIAGNFSFVITVTDGVKTTNRWFSTTVSSASARFYVNLNATGANHGANWDNAFKDLLAALAVVKNGDEIWVAKGTYSPGTLVGSTFAPVSGVKLYGGFAGIETELGQRAIGSDKLYTVNETILTGNSINYHVLYQAAALSDQTLIDGFTITKGKALVGSSGVNYLGAGIYLPSGSAQLSNLWVKDNIADRGAAIWSGASLTINNIVVENNITSYGSWWNNGSSTITNVIFRNNKANGVAAARAGAIYNLSTLTVNNSQFLGNESLAEGGAISNHSILNVNNSVFSRNKVTGVVAATSFGGAITNYAGTTVVANSSFSQNSIAHATNLGGALYNKEGSFNVYNSILWDNKHGAENGTLDQAGGAVAVNMANTLVQGGYDGTAMLFANPLFTAPATDNLRLLSGSPAIDMGDNSKNTTAQDPDGNNRIINGTIDLGAYELLKNEGLLIQPATITDVTRGLAYSQNLSTSGTASNYTWSVSTGTLPLGISLNPTTGQLSGTSVAKEGSYPIAITVTDGIHTGTRQYSLSVIAAPVRLYVSQTAGGKNDGSSWANAFNSLLDAQTYAVSADEIWVAKGSYSPGPAITDYFTLISGVKLYGGFAGTETAISQRLAGTTKLFTVNESILSGADVNQHVIYNASAVSGTTLVDGFTITKGKTILTGATINTYGGGIYTSLGSPVFKNLWIKENTALVQGAGIYNNSAATFDNLIIENNTLASGTTASRFGAGVYNSGTGATFSNITFKNNTTGTAGGAGGMYNIGLNLTLSNAVFLNNAAGTGSGGGFLQAATGAGTILNNVTLDGNTTTGSGGGMVILAAITLNDITVKNNQASLLGGGISNNSASIFNRINVWQNTSVQSGGGMYHVTGAVDIRNAVFWGNKVTGTTFFGGGFHHASGTSKLTNVTFNSNSVAGAVASGGALYRANSGTSTIANSIFWGNTATGGAASQIGNASGAGSVTGMVITNSMLQGGYTGTNNLATDPLFTSGVTPDLRLLSGSPAINTGDNTKVTSIPFDMDKENRIFNTTVDLGAYEYRGAALSIQPSPLNPATRGINYTQPLTVGGGDGPYTWSLASGALPVGLVLQADGSISGIPQTAGSFDFIVQVNNGALTGTKAFTITVAAARSRIYVSQTAAGSNTGGSWTNAFTSLTDALAIAQPDDEIWVAKGTYSPGSTVSSYFTLKEGVKIYGGFAGTETSTDQRIAGTDGLYTVNEAILDGANTSYHVVYNDAALSNATLLDGFTVMRGQTLTSSSTSGAIYMGAGIYNAAGNALFQNLLVKDNIASYFGAGIYNTSASTFKNITVQGNSFSAVGLSKNGAGIYNSGAATFTKIRLTANTATTGGGIYNTGAATMTDVLIQGNSSTASAGGLYNNNAAFSLTNATLSNNTAGSTGGGITNAAAARFTQVTLTNNTATTTGGGMYNTGAAMLNRIYFLENTSAREGAGLFSGGGTVSAENIVFSKNKITGTAAYYGGGLYLSSGTLNLNNATFSNNQIAYAYTGSFAGGGMYINAGTANISNTIFWGNTSSGTTVPDQFNAATGLNLSSSLVQGGYAAGTAILIENPDFQEASSNNLSLKNTSIAIDAGDNSKVAAQTDVAGNPRIVNLKVDLGAIENPTGSTALVILPEKLTVTPRGITFNQPFSVASADAGSLTWSISTGALPLGLTLNPQTGVVSGVPMIAGTYNFVIRAVSASSSGSRQFTLTVAPASTRFYVSVAAAGLNNGSNWSNAFNKLQSALPLVTDGDEIWVAKGTYSPGAGIDSTFYMVSGVKLYGGFAGTETTVAQRVADESGRFTANASILDGAKVNRRLINNTTLLSESTLLDGFTISNGNATGTTAVVGSGAGIYNSVATIKAVFSNLIIKDNTAAFSGGGMYNAGTGVALKNILFQGNTSLNGGALWNVATGVTIDQTIFDNNTSSTFGGGVHNASPGNLSFTKVTFQNNTGSRGGGLYNVSTVNLKEVVFKNNGATALGGGFFSTVSATLDRVSFLSNTAVTNGGGMYSASGTMNLTNVVFSRNNVTASTGNGAGMFGAGTIALTNATFSKNTITKTTAGGAGYYYSSGTTTIYNSILWGNTRAAGTPDQVNPETSLISNSTVEGDFASGVLISVGDPLFTDANNDDLSLKGGSLAIDKGYTAKSTTSKDILGNDRIFNDIVDQGAYESQGGASLKITPLTLPVFSRAADVSIQMIATGGTAPYIWSVLSGKLPDGLTLSPSGLLSGKAMTAMTGNTFVIAVTDATLLGSQQYEVNVTAAPARIYVNQVATAGNNDGSSWQHGFTDFQKAITFSMAGDEIWVAKGNYLPGTAVGDNFTPKDKVKWYGGFAATESNLTDRLADENGLFTANETILNGNAKSYHVITNTVAVDASTIIDGFTVTGGKTATGTSGASYYGAGIYNTLGSLTLRNLLIKANIAYYYGGGIFNSAPASFNNIRFENNYATASNGGGLYNNHTGATFQKLTFLNNDAVGQGAGMFNTGTDLKLDTAVFKGNRSTGNGAGLYQGTGKLTVSNAIFEGNTSSAIGGGLMNTGTLTLNKVSFIQNKAATGAGFGTSLTATGQDLVLKNNTATGNGGGISASGSGTIILDRISLIANTAVLNGGGVYNASNIKIDNAIFTQNATLTNSTNSFGGGMYHLSGTSVLTNTTFSKNTTTYGAAVSGAGFFGRASGTATINNSILWGNTRGGGTIDEVVGIAAANLLVNSSIVQNGYASGTKILIGDPLFTNAANNELHVKQGSPAIDGGDDSKSLTGVDLELKPRIVGAAVDLGAYENQGGETLALLPLTIAAQTRGTNFTQQFTATGGGETLTYRISSGALPLGMELSQAGELSGRPLVAGNYTVVVAVTDGSLVGSKQYNFAVNAAATNLFVNQNASGNNSGSSWKNGLTNLQAAFTAALAGDEIWVAKGTYSPGPLSTDSFILKEGVKVYGGFAATEGTLTERNLQDIHTNNLTVLDGAKEVPSKHVLFNNIPLTAATVLDGFTISGGQTLNSGDTDNSRGGGMYNYAAVKAVFNNLVIRNNYGFRGGGIYNLGPATFSNIRFQNNTASYGAGMYNYNTAVILTDVVFSQNEAAVNGGGLVHNTGVLTLNRVSFTQNISKQHGGGFYHAAGTANLDNVAFSRNSVSTLGNYFGGGMFALTAANLNNTTFNDNTIAYTHATNAGGAGLYRSAGVTTVINSVFWNNTRAGGVSDQLNAGIKVVKAIVQGGYATGTDVLIGDPLFTAAAEDNLLPKAGSPAIDAGDNTGTKTTLDILGNSRVFNGTIDLGAYENQGGSGLVIQPITFNPFSRGVDPQFQMIATGGTEPYSWTLQSGALPTGLTLSATGLISGQPMVTGNFTFVIAVTDGTLIGSKQYNVTVNGGTARLYVHQAAVGNNNGADWKNAFTTLTAALAQTSLGDEVWVAKGTYSPGLTAASFFTLKEGVKWYGGFAATEKVLVERDTLQISTANETILDGSLGTASYHVVYNNVALTAATMMDGFSIQGGKAAFTYSSGTSLNANYYGGGLYNGAGAAIFRNLWIKNNQASYGGGLFHSGKAVYTNIRFSNNNVKGRQPYGAGIYNVTGLQLDRGLFENNNSIETASYPAYGAALFTAGTATLSQVTFTGNTINAGQGGAIYSNTTAAVKITDATFTANKATTGGAAFFSTGTPEFTDVTFTGNTAAGMGGALYLSGSPVFNRVSFLGNTAAQHGAAIWSNGTLKIDNAVFSRNTVSGTAAYYGGAIYISTGTAVLNNISFSANKINYSNASATLNYGGAIYRNGGTVTVNNSILWGNMRGNAKADQLNAGIIISNSIVENNYATGNNIKFGDPMFKDAAADDLNLKTGSLGIDAGDNSKQIYDKDRAGNPREINGTVDLGAYEADGAGGINILPSVLPAFTRGTKPALQLTSNAATAALTWTLESGILPIGVVFSAEGKLTGVPMVIGSYTFVIGATDGTIKSNRQYTVQVLAGNTILMVSEKASGNNNGSDWANAFTELQPALTQSVKGDQVWVAKGTYSPGLTAASTFAIKEGVKWYGGFAGTELTVTERDTALIRTSNETILDGSKGVASYHVITNTITATTNTTLVDGFSIQGGKAASTYASGTSLNLNYYGGGIYNTGGPVKYHQLWIKNNSASYGGGLFQGSKGEFSNIIFSNNIAMGRSARGAAVYNQGGFKIDTAVFENNKINETTSYPGNGAAIYNGAALDLNHVSITNNILANGQGGGLYSASAAVLTIQQSSFTGNQATTAGAFFLANGTAEIVEVSFKDNKALATAGAVYTAGTANFNRVSFIGNTAVQHGGAVWTNAATKIDNSIFSRNQVTSTAAYYGGAVYVSAGSTSLTNNSFSNNTIAYPKVAATLSYGGAVNRNSGSVALSNSVLWGNTRGGGVPDQLNAGIIANNSIVQGNYLSGTEIKFGDPMFENAATDELKLKSGSLAIDAGQNSYQVYAKDFAGNPRVINNLVDLGAYENEGGESLLIFPASINPLVRGELLDLQLTTTGTTSAVTWVVQGGELPVGLVFSPDGKLTGTPTVVGSYTFVIGATDGSLAGNRQFTLNITRGPARLYVDLTAKGNNNGNDWANAFTDLQPAMAQTGAGDEVWVAKGTYYTGALVTSTFTLKEGVKIYGGFAGTEEELLQRDTALLRTSNETILDGSKGVASYHVVYNSLALTNASVLDGFSIQGGKTAVTYSSGTSLNVNYYGGGLYNSAGAALFSNLWIKNNTGSYGGGLFHSGAAVYTNIRFTNNTVTGRSPRGAGLYNATGIKLSKGVFEGNFIKETASYPGYGAGLFSAAAAEFAELSFLNNTILNGQGAGLYTAGVFKLDQASFSNGSATNAGAAYFGGGTVNLSNVTFSNNTAKATGGAIYNASAVLTLNKTSFLGNTSLQHGAALWSAGTLKISNAVFSRNKISSTAAYYGAAVFLSSGNATLTNTTISNNSIAYTKAGLLFYGAGIYRNAGTVTLNNSILWANLRGGALADQANAGLKINNSIVQGGYKLGVNILEGDPLFLNAAADNYAVSGCSPAMNTGDNTLSAELYDLAGKDRVKAEVVDLGAYEYQDPTITINPAVLLAGNRGVLYSQQLTAEGGNGNYTFQISAGKLPDGLSMNAAGLITGNPIVNGKFLFVISVSDGTLCGNRLYNMEVIPGTAVVRILVNQAATAGQNNGSTWDNAYLTLQRAIEVAMAGDQIWVAKGTYSPGELITSTYTLKEGLKIYGGFAATETTLDERDTLKLRTDNETILNGNNINRHVVYNILALTKATLLQGFTITGGRTALANGEPGSGAGIYNTKGAAEFRQLWIRNNKSYASGAGMFNTGNVSLSQILFEGNTASGGTTANGGGLYTSGTTLLSDLSFLNNTAGRQGGAL